MSIKLNRYQNTIFVTVNTSKTYHHASQVKQHGAIDARSIPSVKLAIAKNGERRNHFLLYLLFSLCFLALSCNSDHPNFEPSYSGAPPEEDLEQYLDTAAVFQSLVNLNTRKQLDSLLTLMDKLKNADNDIALIYADTVYLMATEKNWQLSRGIAAYYIALLKGRRDKYGEGIEDALVDAENSKQILEGVGDQKWVVKINNLMGYLYERKPDLNKGLYYLGEALTLINTGGLSAKDSLRLKGEVFHDFANVYYKKDELVTADSFFKESYRLYKMSDNQAALARLKFDWAQRFFAQKEFEEGEDLIRSGLEYATPDRDKEAYIRGYQKLGLLKYKQYTTYPQEEKYVVEALKNYFKCFEYQEEDLYFLHDQIGNAYQRRAFNSNEEALVYLYVDSAIISYKSAMTEAQKEGVLVIMEKMGRNISRLCTWRQRATGEDCSKLLGASSADFLNTNYAALTDTIGRVLQLANTRNSSIETNRLEVKNQQRTRIQWIISGASLLLVAMVFIVLLQRQQQKRLKAKMEALRAQINPHFISNSLNAIESLVNLDKKEEAAKYLIHFSRLSRRILNSSREGNASLAEEIQTLEHFLALEQLRFRDKLQYLIDIDEDLNPKEIEMPAMLLQPYVENAIWHGIKPKAGTGLVKVQVEREGKFLICTVKDNGIGRTKSAEIKSASVLQQKSVAMKINQERLNVVGRAKGAKVDITDLYDEDGTACGTKVTIRLPYKSITSR